MRTKTTLLGTFAALLLLSTAPALAQQPRSYGEGSQATPGAAATRPVSVFKTVDGVVVKADAGEKTLYMTEAKTDQKFKIILDESTKFRLDKKKGGLELVPSLEEGAEIRVVVNTETGVAVSVKSRKKAG